ncbi:hypothetical protein [Methanonatronarchaeum sp. AMET6-2]|uniref:hypothetical protein n=1 Tax=Methanonatronarchaeum sp. AMET6-2 TaxID=2933293 RepID=UPI0012085F2B|nr:hypothetical protein [Methanonatronarchaeum sp. AMET6-2]RZN62666.1 MAG: amino acid-binding protein [Methanonatronarchaeia archaeon]UOY10327.1 hypothetical protein MU439_01465 [Methanonatronarchaeum sp. AMET6-2]
MITTFDLELKDIPGQLVDALEPFSSYGANIVSVVHHREKKTPRGTVPVELKVEVDGDRLERIIDELDERDIQIVQMGEERLGVSFSVVLIGHVVHTGIRDTIDRIDDTGYAEVIDLSLSMPGIGEESSARLLIKTMDGEKAEKTMELIEGIAEEKDLKLIREMEV